MPPRLAALILVPLLVLTRPLRAQERSPIDDLLRLAIAALDDLKFGEADSIAGVVVELPAARRSHRSRALAVSAAARYPELEEAQRPDLARLALARLVRMAPEMGIPREISWRGLDSLHRLVRASTFGATAFPAAPVADIALDGRLTFQAIATRPTRFLLRVRSAEGGPVRSLDSTPPVEQGTLGFRAFAGDQPLLGSGSYRFEILAIDPERTDTIRMDYPASVEVSPFVLSPVPAGIPPERLKPERTRPVRVRAVVVGALAAGATILVSRVMRPSAARQEATSDGRSIGIGIAIGGAAGIGAWLLDRGSPIPANQEANRSAREAFDREIEALRAENERRRAGHRAVITFQSDP
ncbi:MAG: hypothetical protein ACRENB_09235 [Gemmatimonadales bacterium]